MNISKIKKQIINSLRKTVNHYRYNSNITLLEANEMISTQDNVTLIDVRSNQEYQEYHISGAICIPYYEISQKIEGVVPNKNSIIILYCQSGIRSEKALNILLKKGYRNVYNIDKGLDGSM